MLLFSREFFEIINLQNFKYDIKCYPKESKSSHLGSDAAAVVLENLDMKKQH